MSQARIEALKEALRSVVLVTADPFRLMGVAQDIARLALLADDRAELAMAEDMAPSDGDEDGPYGDMR